MTDIRLLSLQGIASQSLAHPGIPKLNCELVASQLKAQRSTHSYSRIKYKKIYLLIKVLLFTSQRFNSFGNPLFSPKILERLNKFGNLLSILIKDNSSRFR